MVNPAALFRSLLDAAVPSKLALGRTLLSVLLLSLCVSEPRLQESRGLFRAAAAEPETRSHPSADGSLTSLRQTPLPLPAEPLQKAELRQRIDAWLQSSWRSRSLEPAALADRRTLARRLSFDLTGLPPDIDDVEAFVHSAEPNAYELLVERWLSGPQFGERMAIFWLDLVRYADTVGYHGDQEHQSSPYRDYVIDAWNQNLPFDRFTREQLAGDLLPNPTPDQLVATCYNRLLQTSHEGGVQAKEYLAIYAADRVRNLSTVWLAATIGCAQCHDHKYDPYTLRDFYALSAFFADVDEERHLRGEGGDTIPTKRFPEISVSVRRERDAMVLRPRPVMITRALPTPRTTRVLPRGNWLDESGEIVEPATPAIFRSTTLGAAQPVQRRLTRLDLAHWLTDAQQGAGVRTAQVLVNRLWALFFGSGLCGSLEDFGAQGDPILHPDLLDDLARDFLASGWDVKRLVRELVTSRAYQRSSQISAHGLKSDPNNFQFARQGQWRLPAESIRDVGLVASGLLVREMGGPSVRPYQPAGYYRYLNFPTREYRADASAAQWRRGVYMHWQRQYLHPMLKAFDAPSREECTAARPRSNTPLAALVLLNDPSSVEAARGLAQLALLQLETSAIKTAQPTEAPAETRLPDAATGASDDEALRWSFTRVLSRPPDEQEVNVLRELLQSSRAYFGERPSAANQLISIGSAPRPVLRVNEQELAAWTNVSRALLNLSEAITRE